MDDYRPQDEYFEWDDIMVYKGPTGDYDNLHDSKISGYPKTLGRSFDVDSSDSVGEDFAWSDVSSLSTTPSSLSSTDSLSLCSLKEDKTDAEIDFPSYDDATTCQSCVTISIDAALALTAPPSPILEPVSDPLTGALEDGEPLSRTVSRGEIHVGARDDFALNIQPFRNVNYLTHDWCEEDIPSTWRYVVSRRSDWAETATRRKSIWKPFNNIPRYENALWRSWAQRRFQLKTVSPDVINWMKSSDETTLYGPFMMTADEFAPATSVLADCGRKTKLRSKKASKPLLKRPAMSEILLRGSIPTFLSTRRSKGETHQTAFQAKPSYDPSVACPGISASQFQEMTSVARGKLGLLRAKKSVRFLNEVEQYEIIKVRVSSKNRRTLKKVASTTLDKAAYNLPAPIKTVNHWNPDSLWSYNPDNSPEKEISDEPWMGIIGEDEDATLCPAPIRIHKQFPAVPDPPPRSKHHARKAAISSIGHGSLEKHLSNLKYEEEVEDELDYLIAIASPQGSLSPPTSDSSSSNSSSSEESLEFVSDEDEFPFFGTGDIADEKARMGIRGIGVRIVNGEENEVERELYREMEEYDLVLG
ncbi:uncharacterized protein LY89DRAFT_732255 [Mollisia scopiformis]|uniref:Nitrogen regulatory protein areA GATA-like domain-containing protein n=1 Tax=Mollisia scopiformis TaxID=149040 RepID=A0A194XG03_MOLSC|nr:uncharacterized protein LY89DRAFT_732255 [Mollisia scopiformis]KUJ18702.1 hypothetical protein LY89DRAFT_732255 [Mollisia scopiformis]